MGLKTYPDRNQIVARWRRRVQNGGRRYARLRRAPLGSMSPMLPSHLGVGRGSGAVTAKRKSKSLFARAFSPRAGSVFWISTRSCDPRLVRRIYLIRASFTLSPGSDNPERFGHQTDDWIKDWGNLDFWPIFHFPNGHESSIPTNA